ncbi:tetraacyldisaccharide 4'-kinase [Hyphobacterium marinum]|uniref:Tetraacyldisaccharide 4'-kinase n=1 Tax=Hyphobacterium marinum TaxID=3116574 RepID=A0ABU7LWM1_9PROT|nr:tetraacyldisaccharide 4'-kinase [Hyphobacterium sp. Y6023]MEE2565969.1 tetraacyldisaccharide 4'-kinase [Hyphobacterium sp. Y6023]
MKPPRFWSGGKAGALGSVAQAAFTPLSRIYEWAGARRIARTVPVEVPPFVVCIGNLTLGGTGKTPIAIAALETFNERKITAHSVTRGYGGSLTGPVRVDPDRQTAEDTGDEPRLLARVAPTWISRDRVFGARQAGVAGAKAIVLDDGYQNPRLGKDFSILVVDGEAGWGNGRVFPAGPLREPVAAGLARAQAVIVMMPDGETEPDLRALDLDELEIPVLTAWLEPVSPPPQEKLVAFAGIGRPQKFFDSLTAAGGQVAETRGFSDHHPYSPRELAELRDLADGHGASLVTTEKDWVRIPAEYRTAITAWPVRAAFREPERFKALLLDAMDAAKAEQLEDKTS